MTRALRRALAAEYLDFLAKLCYASDCLGGREPLRGLASPKSLPPKQSPRLFMMAVFWLLDFRLRCFAMLAVFLPELMRGLVIEIVLHQIL